MADNLESECNLGRHKLDIQEESLLKPIQLTDSGPVVWTVNPGELSKELLRETLENHAEVDCSVQDNTRTLVPGKKPSNLEYKAECIEGESTDTTPELGQLMDLDLAGDQTGMVPGDDCSVGEFGGSISIC